MINTTRRQALKLLSSTLALAGFAGLSSAKAAAGMVSQQPESRHTSDIVFSFVRSKLGEHAIVTIANQSSSAKTIRHLSEGIVHAEGRTYDLNMLVRDMPLTLAAGDVVRLPLAPLGENVDPVSYPQGLTMRMSATVETRLSGSEANGSATHGQVSTVRSVFA